MVRQYNFLRRGMGLFQRSISNKYVHNHEHRWYHWDICFRPIGWSVSWQFYFYFSFFLLFWPFFLSFFLSLISSALQLFLAIISPSSTHHHSVFSPIQPCFLLPSFHPPFIWPFPPTFSSATVYGTHFRYFPILLHFAYRLPCRCHFFGSQSSHQSNFVIHIQMQR